MRTALTLVALLAVAAAGVAAAVPDGNQVIFIPADRVDAAFAKGMPLVETGEYKVHASRREAPGMAEVHIRDTDLIYVLEGSATFVTGGTVAGGKTTAPGEIRGESIQGGTTRRLGKGDFAIVPNGVPHWFKAVEGPLLYYVVKTTAPEPLAGLPEGRPNASVDLATAEGAALVGGEWRARAAQIVEVDFRSPGPDRKPTGPPNRTYDITPRAGAADFDDSAWEVIAPTSLAERRSTGVVCFNWYRIRVTVPERIGGFDPTGATAVFETVVDDYAEVWVDGRLPRELGQRGGSLVAGWNAPNRLVVGRDVRPGQTIQLAVFGMNGPISDAPANYIWMRSAKLDFYAVPRAVAAREVPAEVVRLDPGLDSLVPAGTRIEKLAGGFTFTEGPVWVPRAISSSATPTGT